MTLEELVIELEPVTNWLVLGLHLGVAPEELRRIKRERINVEYSRVMMLAVFMDSSDSTKHNWPNVIGALTDMGEMQLAKSIAAKNECKCSYAPKKRG